MERGREREAGREVGRERAPSITSLSLPRNGLLSLHRVERRREGGRERERGREGEREREGRREVGREREHHPSPHCLHHAMGYSVSTG